MCGGPEQAVRALQRLSGLGARFKSFEAVLSALSRQQKQRQQQPGRESTPAASRKATPQPPGTPREQAREPSASRKATPQPPRTPREAEVGADASNSADETDGRGGDDAVLSVIELGLR